MASGYKLQSEGKLNYDKVDFDVQKPFEFSLEYSPEEIMRDLLSIEIPKTPLNL